MRWFTFALVLVGCGEVDSKTAPLSCQQADSEYGEARQNDVKLRQLAQCVADADCTLWQPTLTCDGRVHLRDCPQATNAANEQAALLRNDELASPVCERIPDDCNIGVSCPNVVAACVSGMCVAR